MQKVSNFLRALSGNNKDRAPVWLMRQAGRYMPSYQALRSKYSLLDLFLEPELAAIISAMPVEQLGVDAAIIFSDITIVALGLGLKLSFNEGPVIENPLIPSDVSRLVIDEDKLAPVFKAIQILKEKVKTPIIGFCGGPFTVASYLVKGGLDELQKWVYYAPNELQLLLDKIAEVSLFYLKGQIKSGAEAFQIFDSWAHVLTSESFERFCVPYYEKLIDGVDAPSILFSRHLTIHLDSLSKLNSALSIDHQTPILKVREKTKKTLQGNIDPDLLFAPISVIEKAAEALITNMKGDPAFIANLGHGVKPGTDFNKVKTLVSCLQEI